MTYIESAYKAWMRTAPLREMRRRCKLFAYGRQWDDIVTDADGITSTEADAAVRAGHHPLTNNMIRQLIQCVIGTFRRRLHPNGSRSADNADFNQLDELDARMLEEFLISGCAIQRVSRLTRPQGSGVWVDNVSPDRFFVNDFRDPRGSDIRLIGMLHDIAPAELLMRFGSDPRALEVITRRWSIADRSKGTDFAPLSDICRSSCGSAQALDFFEAPAGMCRVIEIWTLESMPVIRCHDPLSAEVFLTPASSAADISRLNSRRSKAGAALLTTHPCATLRWHCRWLTPGGEVITHYISPYRHCSHPFAVKLYPLIDGEVHSLVEDIIDQQRHINRLITLIDHILSVSAKGALLFPSEAKPHGMTWSDIADRWARCGAVIPYDSRKSSAIPQQIVSGGENDTAFRLLDLNLRLFQQISGVSDALQGRIPDNHTSAALYESQIQSATNALRDILDSFDSFRTARNHISSTT